MIAQRAALAGQRGDQIVEHFARLVGSGGGPDVRGGAQTRAPEVAQAAHLDERVIGRGSLDDRRVAVDVIGEQRDLGAVRRRLLHDRHRHRPFVRRAEQLADAHPVRLIHRVAEEDAAEDRALRRQAQLGLGRGVTCTQGLELIGEDEVGRDVDRQITFAGAAGADELAACGTLMPHCAAILLEPTPLRRRRVASVARIRIRMGDETPTLTQINQRGEKRARSAVRCATRRRRRAEAQCRIPSFRRSLARALIGAAPPPLSISARLALLAAMRRNHPRFLRRARRVPSANPHPRRADRSASTFPAAIRRRRRR